MISRRAAFVLLPAIVAGHLGADFRAIADQTRGVVILEVDLRTGRSIGSGFAVGDGSLVVTAHHVVEGAKSIRVRLDDETELAVTEVVALDPDHDLALLKVERVLPALVVSTVTPSVGSPVLAVGNPQGLGLAFTDGIVSRIHEVRSIHVIQHSAPISPGNSGGPLLDAEGRVVGVNSFVLASEYGQNVNFAIASEHVSALVADPAVHRPRPAMVLRPPAPDLQRTVEASRAWTAPEGQPRCASPTEPASPFPDAAPIHGLAAVQQDTLGVCRYGQPGGVGPRFVFARYGGVDARDEGLTRILAELGVETVETADPCRRSGRLPRDGGAVEIGTARNRDVLTVWLRADGGDGAELCALVARIRDAAKP